MTTVTWILTGAYFIASLYNHSKKPKPIQKIKRRQKVTKND